MDYFRFLKKKQERNKLKREKKLKAQEEKKQEERKLEEEKILKETKQVKKKITKILTFIAQFTIAAFIVLMIVYYIF